MAPPAMDVHHRVASCRPRASIPVDRAHHRKAAAPFPPPAARSSPSSLRRAAARASSAVDRIPRQVPPRVAPRLPRRRATLPPPSSSRKRPWSPCISKLPCRQSLEMARSGLDRPPVPKTRSRRAFFLCFCSSKGDERVPASSASRCYSSAPPALTSSCRSLLLPATDEWPAPDASPAGLQGPVRSGPVATLGCFFGLVPITSRL